MTEVLRPRLSEGEAAFLARCRDDLEALFGGGDAVVEIVARAPSRGAGPEPAEEEAVALEAHVLVSGRPGVLAGRGASLLAAYAQLRAQAPAGRLALAYRALVLERHDR